MSKTRCYSGTDGPERRRNSSQQWPVHGAGPWPPGGNELVGYSAKEDSAVIDLSKVDSYPVRPFWEEVISEGSEHGARIILSPEKFYLLLSQDSLKVPPEYAAEMTAYDPTSGELRTHYAGFFDPGFGYHPRNPDYPGSRAALEVGHMTFSLPSSMARTYAS